MSSTLKRTSLSFDNYKKRRDQDFLTLGDNNQAKLTMLKKDLRRIINYDHKDGKTYFNNQIRKVNQDATAAGRNISDIVDPRIYQKLNDVIEDQNVNIDVKKRIVEEVYKTRENLQLNQKLYSNLNSFSNALTSNPQINKDELDEAFQANLNFLYGISDEISKIKDFKTLDNEKLNEIFNNSAKKVFEVSKLNFKGVAIYDDTKTKEYTAFNQINEFYNDEFNLQNSVYRNKNDFFNDLDPEVKKDLKLIQRFNQEIGELETKNSKLEKIKDKRIDEIVARVDEIQKEKDDLKNKIDSFKGIKDSSQKKTKEDLKKQYEEKLKSSEKKLNELKKEAKAIYKLATGEKALRDPESKKDKIAIKDETKNKNQKKDANYIKDLLNKSKDENSKLNTKIEENKKTIDNNKNKIQELNEKLEPVKEKLKDNADLLKQKDSFKLKLAEKRSEKGLIENVKSSKIGKAIGFKTEEEKEVASIEDIDSEIKNNNKDIKNEVKTIKIDDRAEFKKNIKDLHEKNKESSKDLKFQERNSLNKGGAIKQVVNKIDKASLKTHNEINLYKNKADKGLETDEKAASRIEAKTNIKKAAQYAGVATVAVPIAAVAAPVAAVAAPVAAVGAAGYGAYKIAKNAPEIASKVSASAVSAAKKVGEGMSSAVKGAREGIGGALEVTGRKIAGGSKIHPVKANGRGIH